MAHLITTLGPKNAGELGMILPHEHVFVDLRTSDQPGYGEADPADVIALMAPELAAARAAGVTALVECSPIGVGRRADILRAVSQATGFPIVAPTGIYREPWVTPWAHAASEDELYEWMRGELESEIEGSGVQAGFVKLSAGDDGLTSTEAKILRAAARAAAVTGAAIGSHTIRGRVVRDQLRIVEARGFSPERFIWIHAHVEPDVELNLEMARRGVWIEYDGIGSDEVEDAQFREREETTSQVDNDTLSRMLRLLDAGFGGRLLISHDRGWYDPGQPGGGTPRPLTYIAKRFLPRLRQAGMDEPIIRRITCDNPFRAFAR
jgi:phosphotriesterase-related protein